MGGFDFSNHNRNAALHAQGVPLPKATSTGTTIVGCLFDGGVVIAADTRATSGPIVADKVRWQHSAPPKLATRSSVQAV
jgi:20S proteasome subunit beta 2